MTYTLANLFVSHYIITLVHHHILLNLWILQLLACTTSCPGETEETEPPGALWSSMIQLPRTHLFIQEVIGSLFQQVYLLNLFLTHVCLSLIRGWFWSDTHHFLHTKLRGKSDISCIQLYQIIRYHHSHLTRHIDKQYLCSFYSYFSIIILWPSCRGINPTLSYPSCDHIARGPRSCTCTWI